MRELTVVFPFFCNLGMFAEQQAIWMDYPAELRSRLHVIVVDDCSPKGQRLNKKAVTVSGLGSLRLFRLTKKKRWNWLACRNLGAKEAQTEWLLLTDIDHGIPGVTLRRLLDGPLDPREAYRFRRIVAPSKWPYDLASCQDWKPHNDTWLLTREMFLSERVGGYDERLSGCYGTSGEFRDRLVAATGCQIMLGEPIIRYPREVIADASTLPSVYTRKDDPANDDDLAERKRLRAMIPGWKPLRNLIPHELVYSSLEAVPC